MTMAANPLAGALEGALSSAASEAGKQAGSNLYDDAKEFLEDRRATESIESGMAYESYLRQASRSLSLIKTILYNQPRSIETLYEPTKIAVQKVDSQLSDCRLISTRNVSDVLEVDRLLIIAGSAGTGKSVIMRHLFVDTVDNQPDIIPIYVELRDIASLSEESSVIDLAYQALCKYGFKLAKRYFMKSLESQSYLFLFDGLDEVPDVRVSALRDSIEELGDRYPLARIIMSSRMADDGFRSWQTFTVAETVSLDKTQALSLVRRLEYEQEAKARFMFQLDDHLYEKHESFASNPLLLTMMLMVFSHRAFIPDDLTSFYRQAFETLLREHDATKSGMFRRELRCGLSDEMFEEVFSHFCFTTFLRDQFGFTRFEALERISAARNRTCGKLSHQFEQTDLLRDLTESVCMLQRDGSKYTFVHRSFQEYFAACYTMKLDDDDKLKTVVMSWLDTHILVDARSSVYLGSLSRLNRERYIRNVLFGPLRDLRDECFKDENPTFCCFEILWNGFGLQHNLPVSDVQTDEIVMYGKPKPLNTLLFQLINCVNLPEELDSTAPITPKDKMVMSPALASYIESSGTGLSDLSNLREAGLVSDFLAATPGFTAAIERMFTAIDYLEKQYASQHGQSVLDNLDML